MGQWGNPQGRCSASSSATTNTDTFSPPTATPKPTSKPTAAPKPTEDWARLVFSSYRTGNCEIYRFEHRDNIFTEINLSKSSRAQDTHPRLNRTADQIVFASDRDRNLEIYRMDINGTSLARLTATPAEDTQPSWSPDSQHIVFASRRDGNWNLYVMNADGTNQHRSRPTQPTISCLPGRPTARRSPGYAQVRRLARFG